jgi:hypothetical protein
VATTFSINILSNGELDNEAMRSAIGQADAGTLPVITQLNDQSGATNHATQAAATAPYVEWDALMGRYVLAFDRPSITTRILTLPVGVSVTGNSWSAAVYGRGIVSANNSQHFTFGLINGGLFNTVAAFSNGYVNPIRSGTQIGVGNIPLDSNPSIMIVTESTLAQTLAVNDYSGSTGISNDTTVYSGGYIGSYASGAGACTHKIVGFAVCNTTLSTAQQTAIRTDAYIRLNILPQVLDQVFIIGDSRVANGRGSPVQTISTELANRLGRTARVFNFGNDSKTSVDVATLTIPTAVSLYKTNAKNTVIYLTGINDFQVGWGGGAGTVTAAQSLAQIKTNITTLKNAGFTVILMNELATTSTTGGANTGLVALRALITAAGASGMGADYLVDLLQYTPFTLPSNTLYYADGVHPTTAADALWASVIAPLIQSSSTVITKT